MIVLAGGHLVLPDRLLPQSSLIIDDDGRIRGVGSAPPVAPAGSTTIDVRGCYVAPGFVDVHVHGVEGHDALDGGDALAAIAARLPRYGVTAFCPTTMACEPAALRTLLEQVGAARASRTPRSARVLPAHLESNFINPDFRGAQPLECIRRPARDDRGAAGEFSSGEVLDTIAAFRPDVGIVTVAPEVDGGLDLVRALVDAGHRVSLGHSGADFETACAAIDAGARHATHLFNRMAPMTHRAPGLAGAVLAREEVAAELICDGFHVHPAMCRVAISAKGPGGVIAITDATGGAGLSPGATATLGGRSIIVHEQAAFLTDGTLAGSTLTMDRAFAAIVRQFGRSEVDAALMCATTPARQLGLDGVGVIADGAVADLVVLDEHFQVQRTFVGGVEVYSRDSSREAGVRS